MKKVEFCIGVDGIKRTWQQIENAYYSDIVSPGGNSYKTPLERLEFLLTKFNQAIEQTVLRIFIDEFERIVKAKPDELVNIIVRIETLKNSSQLLARNKIFWKKIEWAFRYSHFRSSKLLTLAELINVKACLYCNAQFTIVVTNKTKRIAKFQFDHYYSKSKYPYLSISLYNLVPVCASCNIKKTNKDFNLSDFVHPYHDDFYKLTSFSIGYLEMLKMLMGYDVPENDINIEVSNQTNSSVKNYNDLFDLKGIYNRHKDIVKDIFKSAYAYNNGGKKALLAIKNQDGFKFFNDLNEIEKLFLGNYTLSEDINKRPLTKFMQDIAREAGLII